MDWVDEMVAAGHDVKAQVAPRPIGVLIGLNATANPFLFCASYGEVAGLDLPERVVAMRDPERKRRILAEHAQLLGGLEEGIVSQIVGGFDVMFELSEEAAATLVVSQADEEVARYQSPSSTFHEILVEELFREAGDWFTDEDAVGSRDVVWENALRDGRSIKPRIRLFSAIVAATALDESFRRTWQQTLIQPWIDATAASRRLSTQRTGWLRRCEANDVSNSSG